MLIFKSLGCSVEIQQKYVHARRCVLENFKTYFKGQWHIPDYNVLTHKH